VYSYDKVGNRTGVVDRTVVGSVATTVTTESVYDGADQLLTTSVGGAVTLTNTWSADGALASSTTAGGTRTFTNDLAGELDATGALSVAWLTDPTSSTGAPLAESRGGTGTWLLADWAQNTTTAVSTTGSAVTGTRSLDVFGDTRATATGSLATSAFAFSGQYLDSMTGLYDMRARDYDPTTGRFTTQDPLAQRTGMPYFATYLYGYDNPLMYTDPTGEFGCAQLFGLCDSPNFLWNEVVGAGKALWATGSAIIHPMDTYHGWVDACDAGFDQWSGGEGYTGYGLMQCIDNLNPIAGTRDSLGTAVTADCVADSGQAFGRALLGAGLLATPFAKGVKPPVARPTAATRLPQDVAVNPVPPRALPLNRPVGSSASQNAHVQKRIAGLVDRGATDVRVNQHQVDINGRRVGVNRPDLQYTMNGQRIYEEFDTPSSGRGPGHRARLEANDPLGLVRTFEVS